MATTIKNVLTELITTTSAEGAIIVSSDGLPIISEIREVGAEDDISAMTASIMALGTKFANDLSKGIVNQIYVECENGHIVFKSINAEMTLSLFVTKDTRLGMIFMQMKSAISKLTEFKLV